ncbi:DNA-binding transcriptional response regulator, NtrC family, contains REC, AAA-type ATPase, and a Fis-type DNA-binding domains [Arsukibacterium tuosuense]|uniref:DNA-binding transcriptional response regulator, NtrC family, contains REC, AAA-type ATPase, and a Fis-type DNA-binding domains n=1 Tax=Arsukibacterium tuosuense TaxID=1323745 RepID=A0A285JH24_9GAMM|nr:sigma-54 dependent transcriptional regulator [Arsukibacterium tuosuense]SNY58441.1 DNA-binding transcriptional response regulator, NtrC family, contains REC, AAA-type ATPase, and a Fis-type DNA-binding domains [Arsukibacterium tuosuense]
MKILISWLGKTDIDNMQANELASIATLATKHAQPFDKVLILANAWEEHWQTYESWLNKRLAVLHRPATAEIKHQSLSSPTDYQAVAAIMQRNLQALCRADNQIYINLTSGTPAMTAVSVLLGKGIYQCNFLQSARDNTIEDVRIPFDFDATYAKAALSSISAKVVAGPKLSSAFDDMVSESAAMQAVKQKAQKLAMTELPALLLGETGTGKEVLATAIHAASNRSAKALKTVNCGALPENLVDSILFGHVKGAFTGANNDHAGLFEQADGGTLFLDEIGELTPAVQVKLLRALQQGEITRVGDSKTRQVDVRVIAATHRQLTAMVAEGTFREDLFYRIAVGVIELPPLRNRIADIPDFVKIFLEDINSVHSKQPGYESKIISNSAIKFIEEQLWPGNVRALWNALNRAVLWADNAELTVKDIKDAIVETSHSAEKPTVVPELVAGFDIQQYIDGIKENLVKAALDKTAGNKSKAAKLLGLANHQTLANWMKQLGIETEN